MAGSPPAAAGIPERRLAPGESIELDVDFCDLVPSADGIDDPRMRFKGRVVDASGKAGAVVRVFLDAAMAEQTMRKHRVLTAALPTLESGERVAEIPLERKRLTLHRYKSVNGWTSLDIRPRGGTTTTPEDELLADYHWAYAHARNDLAPLLIADGYAVGALELLTITDALATARRRLRHTRG